MKVGISNISLLIHIMKVDVSNISLLLHIMKEIREFVTCTLMLSPYSPEADMS